MFKILRCYTCMAIQQSSVPKTAKRRMLTTVYAYDACATVRCVWWCTCRR